MANKLGPARNRKYLAFYGFPVGTDGVIPTLRDLLLFVKKEPDVAELCGWFGGLTPTPTKSTIFHYTQMIQRLGLFKRTGKVHKLTPEGQEWVDTQNHGLLLSLLTRRFAFVGELLSALSLGPKSTQELRALADQLGYKWKGETQVSTRLFWLSAVGAVEKTGDLWGPGGPYFYPKAEETMPPKEEVVHHIQLLNGLGTVVTARQKALVEPKPDQLPRRTSLRKSTLTTHEIEGIAVEYVIEDLLTEGIDLNDIYGSAPGMGLDLVVLEGTGRRRLIEIKGTTNSSPSSVVVTENELQAMRTYKDEMWLYIVSSIGDRPRLRKYRNPGALDATPAVVYRLRLQSADSEGGRT